MAKKIFTLPWTMQELKTFSDGIVTAFRGGFLAWLNRMRTRPFIIYIDEKEKCKRVFFTEEDAKKWFAERDSEDGLTPETAALEFANIDGNGTIPGTEQYELRVNVPARTYSLSDDKDIYLEFDFATVDKTSQAVVGNPVDVFFTISNGDGTRQKSKIFDYEQGKRYRFKLDEYLATGLNTITLMVRDRTLGISRMVSTSHEVLKFTLSTSYNIAQPLNQMNDTLSVAYECLGSYRRVVHFYVDGAEVSTETLPATQSGANMVKNFTNFGNTYGKGKHTLQLKASMALDDENARIFWTPLVYLGIIVADSELTTTVVKHVFPSSQDPFNGELPGFSGKQFVKQSLDWAYYSGTKIKANVLWRLRKGDEYTTIGSRQADVVEGQSGVLPEPVTFMPTEDGGFFLEAVVDNEVIETYKISIAANEEISEAANDMKVRLTSIGRSNAEEPEFRKDWSSVREGIRAYCDFSEGFPFSAAAGYNNGGVEYYNGYTGIIRGYKPFAFENASVTKNGVCFGMRFRTFNMDDENALVAHIGNPDNNGAGIFIYPNRAVLRSSAGSERDIEVRFKDEEDVDLYWIVYPNHDHQMSLFTFLQVNGIRCFPRIYDVAENYNIGSTTSADDFGLLHLGDPDGKCGLRVYSIRMYGIYQDERQLCNNFIIDSGENLEIMIDRNDIYQQGGGMLDVDVAKLKSRMPVVELVGDMEQMEGSEGKPELSNVGFTLTHNEYDEHYATCELAHLKKAGQSTQDRLGPPSMHVRFNKNKSNVLRDRDGKPYPKNRMPILPGYTPENSLRLLNNTLDSSNCHTGGALSFINEIARDTAIDGKHPLRTPAMDYVLSGKYSEAMAQRHGNISSDPDHWKFPYELSFTPHAYPGAVVYKKDKDSPVVWLGLYTFIEEKKSFYANGGHSIYDAIDENGNPDPFCLKTKKADWNLLYDNTGFLRFEIVTKSPYSMLQKGGELTYDTDGAGREASIEKISEHDNETTEETARDWQEYGNEVVKPLCVTEGNQSAFDTKIWNIFDIYSVCAYYAWMIVLCNTDGSLRNINHVRYQTGAKWKLVPWDWDMILGLLQDTYRLDAPPTADLYTKVDNTFIFNGMGNRVEGATGQDSYWFWDAVLKNSEFKAMLQRMLAAMYSAGMNKTGWFNAFDRFTGAFAPALYNTDTLGKYVNPYFNYNENYLVSDQGDRTAHRHWFLDTNVDFMEQQYGFGDFVNHRTSTRAADAVNCRVYAKAGATAFFGWTISGEITGTNDTPEEGDVESTSRTPRINAGESFTMLVDRTLTSKDILGILSPHKLEELDMHEFARFFSADLKFGNCYNEITKTSLMKKLIVGMTKEDILAHGVNQRRVNTVDGINLMTRLEVLSIRGQRGLMTNPVIDTCHNLKECYAGASGLSAFNPPSGATLVKVELNSSLTSIQATDVTLPADGVEFLSDSLESVDCPTSLLVLNFTGMGDDEGTHKLVHAWLMMLKNNPQLLQSADLKYSNIDWRNATKEDVMMLAKLPTKRLNGYIRINEQYTEDETNILLNAFGKDCFTLEAQSITLVCDQVSPILRMSAVADDDTPKTNVVSTDEGIEILQGSHAWISAVGFPLAERVTYTYQVYFNNRWTNVNPNMPVVNFGSRSQHSLNAFTGELHIAETEEPTTAFQFRTNRNDGATGTIQIKSIARTYPTSVDLELREAEYPVQFNGGVYNISEPGHYIFDANHKPTGYNGRFYTASEDGWWEIVGIDESIAAKCVIHYLEGRSQWDEFCVQIKSLPEGENGFTLRYHSKWYNPTITTCSAEASIMLVSIVAQVLTNSGNEALFKMFRDIYTHKEAFSFDSMELKAVEGALDVIGLLDAAGVDHNEFVTFECNGRNVLDFLVNVTSINADNSNVNDMSGDPIDISKMTQLRTLTSRGSYASCKF